MRSQLRILALEDNSADVNLIRRELRKADLDFKMEVVQNEASFLHALNEFAPDLILADYALPGYDGLSALASVRRRSMEVPVIMVSGALGEERAIEALKGGATDYILKPNLGRLGPAVKHALQDLHEAKEFVHTKHVEQTLQGIIENSPLAMVEWDAELRVTRWTSEAERIFGWSGWEMLGKNLEEIHLFYEDDFEEMEGAFSDLKAGRRSRHMSTSKVRRKDGSAIWCEWYNSALYDDFGNLKVIITLALDVTDKVRTHDVLQNNLKLLQQAILPAKPRVGSGYRVASYYVPAYLKEEVGGDFYDVFETRNGDICVLIGDVAGKGIQAAALATATRSTVRAFQFEIHSTARALTLANEVLYTYSDDASGFVTLHLAVIELASGMIRYSSAGHPPPAIYRAQNGNIEWLEQEIKNLPVRVYEKYRFLEGVNRLGPGDKILFYTDGLSEARKANRFFGLEGIERTLRQYGELEPTELIEKLAETAKEWTGGHLRDDTAIVAIELEKDAQARRQAA